MLDKKHTSYERKWRYVWRNYDNNIHEDKWEKDRVYVPVESVVTTRIAEAIADYEICNKWD